MEAPGIYLYIHRKNMQTVGMSSSVIVFLKVNKNKLFTVYDTTQSVEMPCVPLSMHNIKCSNGLKHTCMLFYF